MKETTTTSNMKDTMTLTEKLTAAVATTAAAYHDAMTTYRLAVSSGEASFPVIQRIHEVAIDTALFANMLAAKRLAAAKAAHKNSS